MTDHTPGPWEVTRTSFRMAGEADRVNRITIAAPGRRVAQIDGPFVSTRDEVEANARLIASAPDLLAALEKIHAREGWVWVGELILKARGEAVASS